MNSCCTWPTCGPTAASICPNPAPASGWPRHAAEPMASSITHGYLEAGLPVGYGEGTAELLGLIPASGRRNRGPEGFRARSQHGSLRGRPEPGANGMAQPAAACRACARLWTGRDGSALKKTAQQLLADHLRHRPRTASENFRRSPPKQKHERPRHWIR